MKQTLADVLSDVWQQVLIEVLQDQEEVEDILSLDALVALASHVMDEEWDEFAQADMVKASEGLDLAELADDDHEWEGLREVVQEVIPEDVIQTLGMVYEMDAQEDLETAVIQSGSSDRVSKSALTWLGYAVTLLYTPTGQADADTILHHRLRDAGAHRLEDRIMYISCETPEDLANALWSLDPFLDPDFWWPTPSLEQQREAGVH